MSASTYTGNDGFWKPSSTTSARNKTDSNAPVFNFSSAPLAQQRLLLPIHKHKRQILYSVERFGVVVIVGETACGKSTQIPHYLMSNGWCDNGFQIVCTQPRRIAAQTLAARVTKEVGRTLGTSVGYTVRFDNKTSENTKIIYVTDGILLREATLTDPLLSRYSVVMVDEAHERNLNTDALLGLLKKIRRKRQDLRIIVCSATIDAQAFLDFFVPKEEKVAKFKRRRWDNADGGTIKNTAETALNIGTIISVDGRQHAVDVLYLDKPTSNYLRSTVETALSICKLSSKNPKGVNGEGDILCFLPSGEDVDEAIRIAQEVVDSQDPTLANHLVFLPLYSKLPFNMQARVFQIDERDKHKTKRRIIFSTNIAETSVTVPRITHVIDSGLVKLPYFDPKTDFERLIVVPSSQASAKQRAGRAGRLQAGQCYRLYTESFFLKLEKATPSEILRTNLSSFILTLKALGVDNILGFDVMDLPGVDSLSHGLESLYALGAIDDDTNLTVLGMDMSSFPTEPRVSRMLLESLREECSVEVAGVCAALQVRSLFLTPRGGSSAGRQQQQLDYESAISEFADSSGDHVTYANVISHQDDRRMDREECSERFLDYVAIRRITEVRDQLLRFLKKFGRIRSLGMATVDEKRKVILKCLTSGFFFNVAKLHNDGKVSNTLFCFALIRFGDTYLQP